jgi:hypothetical protein
MLSSVFSVSVTVGVIKTQRSRNSSALLQNYIEAEITALRCAITLLYGRFFENYFLPLAKRMQALQYEEKCICHFCLQKYSALN